MTDAIVIVLTLALAALVLWLPVWVVQRWADDAAAIAWLWSTGQPVTQVYVQPHMRAGRPVHGYYRRLKR